MDATDASISLAGQAELASVIVCVIAAYAGYPERLGSSRANVGAICLQWIVSRTAYVLRGPRGGVRGVIVMRPEANVMLVDNLAVHPRYQRRGYGRRLMLFAEGQARQAGLHDLLLVTNALMTNTIDFYRNIGFIEVDRRTENGHPRVFMRKRVA